MSKQRALAHEEKPDLQMIGTVCNTTQGSTEGVAALPGGQGSDLGSTTASDPSAGDAGMSLFWSVAI